MIPKVDIKEVSKYPLAFVVLVFGGLVGWLLPKFVDSKGETVSVFKDRNEKLNNTNQHLKAQIRVKDSLLEQNSIATKIENSALKRQNDSLRNVIVDAKTEGLERVIKIISGGGTSIVIKPKKK